MMLEQTDTIKLTANATTKPGYNIVLYRFSINGAIHTQDTNEMKIQASSLPVGRSVVFVQAKDDCGNENWSAPDEIAFDVRDGAARMDVAINGTVSISGDIGPGIELIRTDRTTHFTDRLLKGMCEMEALTVTGSKYMICGITIQSVQSLNYRLIFWGDCAAQEFLGAVSLDLTPRNSDAVLKIGSQYRLNVEDLKLVYHDYTASNKLYLGLMNLSNEVKLPDISGAVRLTIKVRRL